MLILKKTRVTVAILVLMAAWSQPTLALSAKGLQALQAREYAQTDDYVSLSFEKSSPLQALLLNWLGADTYSRLLNSPQYVALENFFSEHFN